MILQTVLLSDKDAMGFPCLCEFLIYCDLKKSFENISPEIH